MFDRTTRSVNLTEAGRIYLERISPALANLREATEDLQLQAGVEGGTLRLTISHPAGKVLVEPMLAEFFAHHPHIHVELVYDDGFVDIVRETSTLAYAMANRWRAIWWPCRSRRT